MSGYIADLLIKVDSSEVESATQKLNELVQASKGLGNSPLSKPVATPKAPSAPKPQNTPGTSQADKELDKAAKAEQKRYDKWLELAARQEKEETANSQRRLAIIADESKTRTALQQKVADQADAVAQKRYNESNQRVAAQLKVAEQADAAELKRYNAWLKEGDKRTDAEKKQQAAVASSRDKYVAESQQRLANAAKASADADIKAQNLTLAEAQRIDKLRIKGTIQRIKEEEKAELNAIKALEKAEAQRQGALKNVSSEFDPSTSEIKRLNEKQSFVKQNQSSYTAAEYERINKNIDAARVKAEKYGGALGRTALSAKQLQLAQQGLPAQFTDIIVSLQGGQAPLTVLLQQGGQIKDMFGGLGSAFAGITQAIKPFVNPVTAAAAALVVLGLAYDQGSKEADAYRLALVSTGNAAGTTVAGLSAMAQEVDNTAGTSAKAAEVLAQLAASGNVTAGSFVELTTAAVKWEKASGIAAAETVKQFAALGDTPLTAAKKLNDQVNFLTASVYQQAAAMVKQGRETDAATLLQEAYADALLQRSDEIIEKQGWVEKSWGGIKNAAAEAWDAMLNVGRANTLEDDLDDIVKTINRKTAALSMFGGGGAANMPSQKDSNDAWTNRLQQEADDMQKAREQMFKGEHVKQATKDFDEFQKGLENNAVKAEKLSTSLEKLNKKVAFMRKSGFTISDKDVTKAQDQLKEKYKDTSKPKSAILDDTDVNDFQNKVSEIKAQYSALNEAVKAQQEAGTVSLEAGFAKRHQLLTEEAAKTKAAYQEQITALEALKGAKNLSANQSISLDRKIADARSKMTVAELEAQKELDKSAAEEEKRRKRQIQNVKAYNESLQQMIENLRVAGVRERAGISQSSQERGVNDKLNSEDDRYNDEVRSLNNQRAENPELAGEVSKKLDDAARAHTDMKDQIVRNYEDMKVAQKDWGAGVSGAFKQYIEDGQNYAGLVNQAFTSSFTSMEDAIVSFVSTGKASFSDLAKSILADMARIAVKAAASAALQSLFGAGMAAWGGGAATSAGSTAAGYNNLAGWGVGQAKGGAWAGGTQFFAKGGAFTNSVVSKPTAFGSSTSSNNIMGEAGPEAIMPLSRGSDGSLGVRAQVDVSGLQQQSTGGVNVYIDIAGDGKTSTSSSDPGYSSFGNEVGQFVDQRYRQLLSKDLSPGGDIWKSMQG